MTAKSDRQGLTRRQFIGASATAMAAGVLTACSGPAPAPTAAPTAPAQVPIPATSAPTEAAPAKKVKITMWGFPLGSDDVAMFRPMQQAFTNKNPNIEVAVQIEPWAGREQKMLAAIAAGNPPDCVYLNPDFYPKFVASDALAPIDDFLEKGFRDDYLPGPLEAVTHGGKTYGLPVLTSAYTQIYNKALVEKAGITEIPSTFDTFSAAVKKVHNPSAGIWGVRFDLGTQVRSSLVTTFVPFLWAAGGEMYSEDGKKVTFDGPEGEVALDYMVSFYRDKLVQEANLTGGGLPFTSGQVGFELQVANNYLLTYAEANPDLEIGITPTLKEKKQVGFGTVGSYAVFKKSQNPKEAAQWLASVTSRENTVTILKASGFISPRKSVRAEEYCSGPSLEAAAQAQYMRPEPKHVKSREVLAAMQPEAEAAVNGTKSVKEALQAAAKACNALLA